MHREHWNDPDEFKRALIQTRNNARAINSLILVALVSLAVWLSSMPGIGSIGTILGTLVVVIGAVIIVTVQVSVERAARRVDHPLFCQKCGYNMKGLPTDVTKCPECGSVYNRDQLFRQHAQDRAAESPENG